VTSTTGVVAPVSSGLVTPARRGAGGWGGGTPQGILPLGRGSGLALGLVTLWMSVLVLLPLTAVLVTSMSGGPAAFVDAISSPAVAASIRLTVFTAAAATVVSVTADAGAPSGPSRRSPWKSRMFPGDVPGAAMPTLPRITV